MSNNQNKHEEENDSAIEPSGQDQNGYEVILNQIPSNSTPTNPNVYGLEEPRIATYHNPEKQIDRIWQLMMGLLAFVVISFLGTLFILIYDQIKEKDLYLEYSKFYKEYSEKNIQLNNSINQNLIEVNNLNNEIKILKARNSYLK